MDGWRSLDRGRHRNYMYAALSLMVQWRRNVGCKVRTRMRQMTNTNDDDDVDEQTSFALINWC